MGSGSEPLLATESARIALRDFGIKQARLTHLASRHNDVFRVGVPRGKNYVLRLQNDLMSDAQAASQLRWMKSISKESGVCVPTPIRTADDKPFTHISTAKGRRRAVLLQWLPGKTARARSDETYSSAAVIIARMHQHAETFRAGRGFSCRTLDGEWLFGERFFVRSPAARHHVTAAARRVAHDIERLVRDTMETLGKHSRRFGVIHADLNLDNILFYRRRASPIDFDEWGRGWYLFDLAELIRTSVTPENRQQRKQLVISAYQRVRALDGADIEAFDAFIAATFVQYMNWAFIHARDARDLRWIGFCVDVLAAIRGRASAP